MKLVVDRMLQIGFWFSDESMMMNHETNPSVFILYCDSIESSLQSPQSNLESHFIFISS